MRPHLHRKALIRFATAAAVAVVVPVAVVAMGGAAAPLGIVAGVVAGLLGVSVLEAPRRRVTGRARA